VAFYNVNFVAGYYRVTWGIGIGPAAVITAIVLWEIHARLLAMGDQL
jgi:hypothetical protein